MLNKILTDKDGLRIDGKYVFFYSNKCPFSNFYYPCSFTYSAFGDRHRFFTSEQAFMWHKAKFFGDETIANTILQANDNPKECKRLGRLVKDYDDDLWDDVRYNIFLDVLIAKFSQDEKLKEFITDMRFEGKEFVEASPTDAIWGIGMSIDDPNVADKKYWKGRNLLGNCLTDARTVIRVNSAIEERNTLNKKD